MRAFFDGCPHRPEITMKGHLSILVVVTPELLGWIAEHRLADRGASSLTKISRAHRFDFPLYTGWLSLTSSVPDRLLIVVDDLESEGALYDPRFDA